MQKKDKISIDPSHLEIIDSSHPEIKAHEVLFTNFMMAYSNLTKSLDAISLEPYVSSVIRKSFYDGYLWTKDSLMTSLQEIVEKLSDKKLN